jgi:hypothetical protein
MNNPKYSAEFQRWVDDQMRELREWADIDRSRRIGRWWAIASIVLSLLSLVFSCLYLAMRG